MCNLIDKFFETLKIFSLQFQVVYDQITCFFSTQKHKTHKIFKQITTTSEVFQEPFHTSEKYLNFHFERFENRDAPISTRITNVKHTP